MKRKLVQMKEDFKEAFCLFVKGCVSVGIGLIGLCSIPFAFAMLMGIYLIVVVITVPIMIVSLCITGLLNLRCKIFGHERDTLKTRTMIEDGKWITYSVCKRCGKPVYYDTDVYEWKEDTENHGTY